MRSIVHAATAAATAFGLSLAAVPAHAGYVLQDISGGGVFQSASDINNLGQVVGSGGQSGYLYTPGAGLTALSSRPPGGVTGPVESRGVAINDNGQIAGNWSGAGTTGWRGFTMDPGGSMLDMGQSDLGMRNIDARGRAVGLIDLGGSPEFNQLFINTPRVGGSVISPPGGIWDVAGIRGDDAVVGNHWAEAVPYGGLRAALFQDGQWNDFALPGISTASWATGFNEQGVVVGSVETPYVELKTWLTRAGAWVGGQFVDIGAAFPSWYSQAEAVNASGLVIGSGYASWDGSGDFNFLYDLSTSTFTDLATALDPASTAGWTDLTLADVNDLGQIVGSGLFNGERRAILLSLGPTPPVPEPGTVLMMLAGGVLVTGAVRRRASGAAGRA